MPGETEITETPEPKDETLTITREDFEKQIKAAAARAAKAERSKAPAVTADDLAELDQLRKDREQRELQEAERKGEYDKALKSQAESLKAEYEPKLTESQQRIAALTDRLRQTTVRQELLRAAAAHNAYDAEQVAELLDRHVTITDDFEVKIQHKDGSPRFVGADEMTIDQMVEEFLGKHPNLVKAGAADSPAGGAGGGAATKGAGKVTPLAEAEAELKAIDLQYAKTRDSSLLPKIVAAQRKVNAAKRATS